MEIEKFKKYLKFLLKSLNDAYSMYHINERINDWYERDKDKYIEVDNDLGFISYSLKEVAFLSISKLFDNRDKDSISVQGLVKLIFSCKIVKDDVIYNQLKTFAQNIDNEINNNKNNLDNIILWRDKYFAHYDKKILNDPSLFVQANYNSIELINLVKTVYDELNNILVLINDNKISLTYDVFDNSIDNLFFKYEVADKILHSENQSFIEELYKTIDYPKNNS